MKFLQKRKQVKLKRHIACPDMYLTLFQVHHLLHHFHALLNLFIPFFHIRIQHLPFGSQSDSPGSPLEQRYPQALLQSFQGLAHRRLGYGQFVSRPGGAPQFCRIVKYLVILQISYHKLLLFRQTVQPYAAYTVNFPLQSQSGRGTFFSPARRAGHPSAFADIPPPGHRVHNASATIFPARPVRRFCGIIPGAGNRTLCTDLRIKNALQKDSEGHSGCFRSYFSLNVEHAVPPQSQAPQPLISTWSA